MAGKIWRQKPIKCPFTPGEGVIIFIINCTVIRNDVFHILHRLIMGQVAVKDLLNSITQLLVFDLTYCRFIWSVTFRLQTDKMSIYGRCTNAYFTVFIQDGKSAAHICNCNISFPQQSVSGVKKNAKYFQTVLNHSPMWEINIWKATEILHITSQDGFPESVSCFGEFLLSQDCVASIFLSN